MIVKALKKCLFGSKKTPKSLPEAATVVSRADHTISRQDISHNALKVLSRLNQAGFDAYLVGGCLRDLLLGKHPKDFDIATNALPEQVYKLFRNCRLIGRRFRLAHVYFHRELIEVATFRGHHTKTSDETHTDDGMIFRDNEYGTLEEDAERRDFTINALYYTTKDFSLVDFTGGLEDLDQKRIRIIGDPETRFREDPVRLLRAVRFSAKLDFTIEPKTLAPMAEMAALLANVPPARLFEEFMKFFHYGFAFESFSTLCQHQLFHYLSEPAATALSTAAETQSFFEIALRNTDQRVNADKPTTPAFLMAVFLWPYIQARQQFYLDEEHPPLDALHSAITDGLDAQRQCTMIPKKIVHGIRDILHLQHFLLNLRKNGPYQTLSHPRFRAAYDFLLLRSQAGEPLAAFCTWWTDFQSANQEEKQHLLQNKPE